MKVERLNGGEITPEDKELAFKFLLGNCAGKAILKTLFVFDKLGQNGWRLYMVNSKEVMAGGAVVRRDPDGNYLIDGKQRNAIIRLPKPVELVHGIRMAKTEQHKSYMGQYLTDGKLHSLEEKERAKLINCRVEVEEIEKNDLELAWSYWEEDWFWLTWVQRCEKPLRGLVVTITTTATRTVGSGGFPVF